LRRWTVREYRSEDARGVRELYATVFRYVPPLEHFVWKFNDNPAGRGIITVAEDSGRIVGHGALMPTPLRVGSESIRGAQGVDAMTHPDYRNQGMFVALSEVCAEQAAANRIEVLYTMSGHPGVYGGAVRRLSWDHTGDIAKWVRVLCANSQTFPRSKRVISLGLQFMPLGRSSARGVEVRMEPPKEDEFVSLNEQVASSWLPTACRIEHSADWFRWRFDRASQRHYIWFSAYREGDLKAWAVFGMNDWGEVPIIDVCGTDDAALRGVSSRATRRAKELGLAMLLSFTNDDNVARALRSCGYLRHGSTPLIVRSLTSKVLQGNIHDHSSWHLAAEDFDTF